MKISKTLFKEYSKCNAFYGLDQIYYKKFKSGFEVEDVKDMLMKMFDDDGEDNVRIDDEKLMEMQEYYKEVERVCLKEASIVFNKNFKYSENNEDQMMISFYDKNGNQFYTYLDGYDDSEDIIVIEVKATTSRKYLNLGPQVNKVLQPIFSVKDSIITLKEDTFYDKNKIKHYNKLFDRYEKVGKYVYDIAVTNFILKGFIKDNHRLKGKKVRLYLGLLNSNYIYDGISDYDINNNERVVHFLDVTNLVNDYDTIINNDYNKLLMSVNDMHKKDLYQVACDNDCVYCDVCFPAFKEKYCVKTLLGSKSVSIGGEKNNKYDLVNNGYNKITDIPYDLLTNEKHIMQRDCIDRKCEYMDEEMIENIITENIKFPIYHLDFESFQSPLPRFKNETPYMQSVFQFSIHIQREPFVCDKDLDNVSFIPHDFLDHREELIQEMIRTIDLSKGGTVLVYNKIFERDRILEMSEMFPQYKDELEKIVKHIFDLKDILTKGDKKDKGVNYYHYDLDGSYSIKKVLPIFTNISYSDLNVKNGSEAQVAYAKFNHLPKEDIEEIRDNLITYCKQDTYAMVEILIGIIKKIRCY